MALPRYFLEQQVLGQESEVVFALRLEEDDFRHARAQRLEAGEHIAVIDAAKDYFECEIVEFDQGLLRVRIAGKKDLDILRPSLMLVQGLAKGEKMDTIIRHATELGVGAFVPFVCERSIVKLDEKKTAARMKRWQGIAKSAAMQSGQASIPEISEPLDLAGVCSLVKTAAAVLVCWEEETETGLREGLRRALEIQGIADEDARVAIVVGPEGGLAPHEVEALLSCSKFASSVSLGSSILRTETAGIVAPALVLYELGALS